MSKELVISATSHERRVAILEEGQLVEIYIEREKEFALVGSIYKGKVTRVLPGMQSAFVDIGLDGDAFLYVSDVFENLEDYDHGHGHESGHGNGHAPAPQSDEATAPIEVLPGETLGRAQASASAEAVESVAEPGDEAIESRDVRTHVEEAEPGAPGVDETPEDERQPDSNESAPQNFAPQYNPTQYRPSPNYGPRGDRGERGNDRGGDRGGERSGRGDRPHFGRGRGRFRGRGRGRGGRDFRQGGGRDLPPSKYAPPQGGERGSDRGHDRGDRRDRGNDRGGRGYSNRGGYENRGPRRDFENRGGDSPRPSGPAEEEILLPGESLAKYRDRPQAQASAPVAEERPEKHYEPNEPQPRVAGQPAPAGAPRRSRGGLPSWLLAGAPSEAVEPSDEAVEAESDEIRESVAADIDPEDEVSSSADVHISDEEATDLSTSIIDAKQDLVREGAEADSAAGSGAIFEEEGEEEVEEDVEEETEEDDEEVELDEEESEDAEEPADEPAVQEIVSAPQAIAEAEADAAHENALHIAALGEHVIDDSQETEDELEAAEALEPETAAEEQDEIAASAAPANEDAFLLPGETRAPHTGTESQGEFPRQSARVGGNPRSRFQRPFRGGRDRDRGGDRGGRGGRHDRRGGDRGRGRFDRRGGDRGPRQHHGHGHHGHHHGPRRPQLISEMLKPGQEIVVQIAKEPLGKKGARITSHIALPGRFLVYMPTIDHIGVSRKIASAENRSRLRRIVGEARGSYPGGFIVRTAAGAATDEEIRTDIEFLGRTWADIKKKHDERKSPAILHHDLNLVERILRDYVSDDFTAIWIDNEEEYGKVCEFVSRFQPKLISRVKLYSKEQPIFEEFGIQHELDKALRAKVWLKSGGYIVINHTEALVAIDVNTGKFVGKGSTRLEDTIVKTNLEAVKEIVRQIRLRDLGGIIVVDFIDMEERRNREKVLSALQQALEQDKAPSKALSFNEFGLVCITRKRTKQALERVLCQPCPSCTGSGMVKSIPTLCYEIQNEARKMASTDPDNPNLTLRVHPEIAKALKTRESMLIDELEQNSHKHIIIQSDATLHWEQYDIY
jgi:Rne/Rng family ribonuclease